MKEVKIFCGVLVAGCRRRIASRLGTGCLFVAFLLFACPSPAAVKPGENLVVNGTFDADQAAVPPFWQAKPESAFGCSPSGGPNGLPYVTLKGNADRTPMDANIRQYGLSLATNGRFRISFWVRTRDFVARDGGLVVPNCGWLASAGGIKDIPRSTDGEWRKLEREFTGIPSKDGTFFTILYADGFAGEIDFADVRFEAVDEIALRDTELSAVLKEQALPRIVPMEPLLCQIPKDDPSVSFRFFGKLPKADVSAYDLVLTTDDAAGRGRAPLAENAAFRVPLPKGAAAGRLTASVVDRADGRTIATDAFAFRTADVPQADPSGHRRLNNFVTEVLSAPLDGGEGTFGFSTMRDGWVFVAVKAEAHEGFSVRIDGHPAMDAKTPRRESFRQIGPGRHVLTVAGAGAGSVVVRSVAETFNYQPGVDSPVPGNGKYDWAFERAHGLKAIITENNGIIPDAALKEFRKSGHRWVPNDVIHNLGEQDLCRKMKDGRWLKDATKGGVSMDEVAYQRTPQVDAYTKAIRAFDRDCAPTKPVYTWIIGNPLTPGVDHSFISACINCSQGRSRLMSEVYCRTAATEDEARGLLKSYIGDKIDRYRAWFPASVRSLGIVFGNFNQLPIVSVAHHPEVDYKHYLDMQFNYAANDPSCRDLGCIGLWGSVYADEELRRWSYELVRHYAIEGATNMLSEAYGYRYRPDHLLNGDFRGTFGPWAASGDVRLATHPRLGCDNEGRWYAEPGLGDTFAQLTRTADGVATLRQTAKGLVPGRAYCLQFVTFDVDDVRAKRHAPRRFGIDATLSAGAEIRPDRSWVFVDERVKGNYANCTGVARVNIHHTVFTARAETVDIAIGNGAAQPGEALGVNGISLNPYFEDTSR